MLHAVAKELGIEQTDLEAQITAFAEHTHPKTMRNVTDIHILAGKHDWAGLAMRVARDKTILKDLMHKKQILQQNSPSSSNGDDDRSPLDDSDYSPMWSDPSTPTSKTPLLTRDHTRNNSVSNNTPPLDFGTELTRTKTMMSSRKSISSRRMSINSSNSFNSVRSFFQRRRCSSSASKSHNHSQPASLGALRNVLQEVEEYYFQWLYVFNLGGERKMNYELSDVALLLEQQGTKEHRLSKRKLEYEIEKEEMLLEQQDMKQHCLSRIVSVEEPPSGEHSEKEEEDEEEDVCHPGMSVWDGERW